MTGCNRSFSCGWLNIILRAMILISISTIIFFAGLTIVKINPFINISFIAKNASFSDIYSNFYFFKLD